MSIPWMSGSKISRKSFICAYCSQKYPKGTKYYWSYGARRCYNCDNDAKKMILDWPAYLEAIKRVFEQISRKNEKFDAVVGLSRGGLIPAVMFSHAFNIPMIIFNPHSLHVNGIPRIPINLDISPAIVRRILIIDDISDSGKTLNKSIKFFKNCGFMVKTATVYTNEKTRCMPNFTLCTINNWVTFPYEEKS